MIKINVVEIKKQLTGEKDFRFDVGPDELGLSEQDLPVDGQVHIEGKITNAGDVLLVNVSEKRRKVPRRRGRSFIRKAVRALRVMLMSTRAISWM